MPWRARPMGAYAELLIDRSPATVFSFLCEPRKVAQWRGPGPATGEVLAAEPPRLLRYRTVEERFETVCSYELAEQGGATLLRHRVEARARYRIARMLAPPAEACAAARDLADLERLKSLLEASRARLGRGARPAKA
jgi:uncharacterized protein YndB with AHSA1/START domain